mmetsp:Transcript_17635/g.37432  ORF Transcript_17635/g.37432 Transcript_17635/m.37432 type:complete len:281 (-) Transcript_17635:34-876(-)
MRGGRGRRPTAAGECKVTDRVAMLSKGALLELGSSALESLAAKAFLASLPRRRGGGYRAATEASPPPPLPPPSGGVSPMRCAGKRTRGSSGSSGKGMKEGSSSKKGSESADGALARAKLPLSAVPLNKGVCPPNSSDPVLATIADASASSAAAASTCSAVWTRRRQRSARRTASRKGSTGAASRRGATSKPPSLRLASSSASALAKGRKESNRDDGRCASGEPRTKFRPLSGLPGSFTPGWWRKDLHVRVLKIRSAWELHPATAKGTAVVIPKAAGNTPG